MSESQFKIFVVDDDTVAQMITVDLLAESRFEVEAFDSGEACLAALGHEPDLILMDVEMPGRDGIATCREIRAAGQAAVQVIFVSGHDDLETRLAAYDAGGDDFIVKPFAPAELMQKVRLAEQHAQHRVELAQTARFAQQTAFTAMTSMSEMGVVLKFLHASFGSQAPGQLAQAVFQALAQYGLHGIVETRGEAGAACYSASGVCTPLETSIVQHARGMDRIFQFSDRLAINYPRITLLVPNLPLDDADRVGRLRDHLAVIAEGAEMRLLAMESESRRLAQAAGLLGAAAELSQALAEIEAQQGDNRLRGLEMANNYLDEIERAFVHLGLTESQE